MIQFVIKNFWKFLLVLVAFNFLHVLVTSSAIISAVPIFDLILHPDLEGISDVTNQVITYFKKWDIPISLTTFMVVLGGLTIVRNIFSLLIRRCTISLTNKVGIGLQNHALHHFFSANWSFFSETGKGTLYNTFISIMPGIGQAIQNTAALSSSFLQFLTFLIIPFSISWQMSSIAVLCGLVASMPITFISKLSYKIGIKSAQLGNDRSSSLEELLGGSKIVLGYGKVKLFTSHYLQKYKDLLNLELNRDTANVGVGLMYEPLALISLMIAIFLALRWNYAVSEIAIAFFSLKHALDHFKTILHNKNALAGMRGCYIQYQKLARKAQTFKQKTGSIPFSSFQKSIIFQDLSFSYPSTDTGVKNISINILKGKTIALIGSSGAGKSTIIDLLIGFYEPSQGAVLVDGTPLHDFDIASYRQKLGYVPQDPVLLNRSIKDNLLWVKEDATDQELLDACRKANVMEFMDKLEQGMDTIIGDRGVRLSGGQCQRIALARALVVQPQLLILDEATSALDTESERFIQNSIEELSSSTTIVIIAHRLSTITKADYIYVLNEGQIVEEGTYEQLRKESSRFSKMLQMQNL